MPVCDYIRYIIETYNCIIEQVDSYITFCKKVTVGSHNLDILGKHLLSIPLSDAKFRLLTFRMFAPLVGIEISISTNFM